MSQCPASRAAVLEQAVQPALAQLELPAAGERLEGAALLDGLAVAPQGALLLLLQDMGPDGVPQRLLLPKPGRNDFGERSWDPCGSCLRCVLLWEFLCMLNSRMKGFPRP